MKKPFVFLLAFCNVALLGTLLYFYAMGNNNNAVTSVLENSAVTTAPKITLPADAVKISECIPFMGEHWIQPSKLPLGPIYSVYKGKVTAIEYMFTPDKIPGEQGAKMTLDDIAAYMAKNNLTLADIVKANQFHLDTFGASIQFISMDWSAPHSGLAAPHYDVHAYLVDKTEAAQICPEAKIDEVYSVEVLDNVKKYKIPFPESPAKK
jgi:hypothetical protein